MSTAVEIERNVNRPATVARPDLSLKIALALAPFSFFIDLTSPYLVYAVTGFEDSTTGYPVSLFALPLIMLIAVARINDRSLIILQFVLMLVGLIAFSCIYNATLEPVAYGALWVMPFLWLFYFIGSELDLTDGRLFRVFIYSFCSSTAYLCAGGALEFLFYGSLLADGRMSSNLVLPGQYQLYVYMPTIVALASLVCVGVIRSGAPVFRGALAVVIGLTAYALFLAAAREAILTFLVGLAGILLCTTRLRLFLFVVGCVFILGLILAFSDQLIAWAAASEYSAISKFAQVQDADQQFGSRDIAIAQYWDVFRRNMILGTGFRSPFVNYFGVPVNFPSAHNFYADTRAWTGIAGSVLVFGILLWFSGKAVALFFRSLSMDAKTAPLARGFAMALLVGLVISNNINVPMRQPLLAPIFGLLLYGAFFFTRSGRAVGRRR